MEGQLYERESERPLKIFERLTRGELSKKDAAVLDALHFRYTIRYTSGIALPAIARSGQWIISRVTGSQLKIRRH